MATGFLRKAEELLEPDDVIQWDFEIELLRRVEHPPSEEDLDRLD